MARTCEIRMTDIFFEKQFIDFYGQHTIETDNFLYPFLIIDYDGILSISSLGYQGPLWKKPPGMVEIEEFVSLRADFVKKSKIVCEFARFNPIISNHINLDGLYSFSTSSSFFVIDVNKPPENYLNDLPVRARSVIRKDCSCDMRISKEMGIIQNSLIHSNDFYYDNKTLDDAVKSSFAVQIVCGLNGEEVAASLFFASDDTAYYIANASNSTGKRIGANVRIMYEFYKYAYENKIKQIGLGGGLADGDNLSIFKKQFSTRTLLTRHLKLIHNEELYFKASDNKKEGYFPPYLLNKSLLKLRLQPQKQ
ncbi:MAG: hypothetical protein AB7T10_09585 [bacterium]